MELNNDFKGSLVNKRLKKFLRHSLIIYAFFYYNSWLIDKMYLFVLKKKTKKKKHHWAPDTDISAGVFIANQFANQFSINARKDLYLLNSIFLPQ